MIKSPGSIAHFTPSTVVKAPRPWTTRRSAAGVWWWLGAASPGRMICSPANRVEVTAYAPPRPGFFKTSTRRSACSIGTSRAASSRSGPRSRHRHRCGTAEVTRSFREELEAAVNARHSRLNPFTEKWVRGELTRAQLGAWAAQHYQYVSKFPRWCATVYGECPDPDARDFLLENIIEEESGTKHVDLLIRFAEACGVSRAEVETA